jgi:hypothetical protein
MNQSIIERNKQDMTLNAFQTSVIPHWQADMALKALA